MFIGPGVTGGAAPLIRFDLLTAESTDERGDSFGEDGADGDDTPPAAVCETVVVAGEVAFPNAAEGVSEFIETYVVSRARDDARRDATVDAAAELDDVARDWEDAAFTDLPAGDRDCLLREFGVDTADPVQDETLSERLRPHVVDELSYALYVLPTDGRLIDIEGPIGHPGGTESYRRTTMDASGGLPDPGGEHDG